MESKDYYAVLGVQLGASEKELRLAYRKLAHQYHPDISKAIDAQTRMREINEAYEVLRDAAKRATYDDLRAREKTLRAREKIQETFSSTATWRQAMRGTRAQKAYTAYDFRAWVAALFKGKLRPLASDDSCVRRGEDYHAWIDIDLEDTLKGATHVFTLHRVQANTLKFSQLQARKINVPIPIGIREGQRICINGQGMPGYRGEAAGDLYLEVCFKPHRLYRVEGGDLFLALPVSPWEAALGARVTVPTLTGTVQVSIPPGSSHGSKLRLKGCGLSAYPQQGLPQGDLYLTLALALPPAETEVQRQAYRDWARQFPFDPRTHFGVSGSSPK